MVKRVLFLSFSMTWSLTSSWVTPLDRDTGGSSAYGRDALGPPGNDTLMQMRGSGQGSLVSEAWNSGLVSFRGRRAEEDFEGRLQGIGQPLNRGSSGGPQYLLNHPQVYGVPSVWQDSSRPGGPRDKPELLTGTHSPRGAGRQDQGPGPCRVR